MKNFEQVHRLETESSHQPKSDSILDNTFEGVIKLKEKTLTPLRGSDVSQKQQKVQSVYDKTFEHSTLESQQYFSAMINPDKK